MQGTSSLFFTLMQHFRNKHRELQVIFLIGGLVNSKKFKMVVLLMVESLQLFSFKTKKR